MNSDFNSTRYEKDFLKDLNSQISSIEKSLDVSFCSQSTADTIGTKFKSTPKYSFPKTKLKSNNKDNQATGLIEASQKTISDPYQKSNFESTKLKNEKLKEKEEKKQFDQIKNKIFNKPNDNLIEKTEQNESSDIVQFKREIDKLFKKQMIQKVSKDFQSFDTIDDDNNNKENDKIKTTKKLDNKESTKLYERKIVDKKINTSKVLDFSKMTDQLTEEAKLQAQMEALQKHRFGLISDLQLREAQRRFKDPRQTSLNIKSIQEKDPNLEIRRESQIKSLKEKLLDAKNSADSHLGPTAQSPNLHIKDRQNNMFGAFSKKSRFVEKVETIMAMYYPNIDLTRHKTRSLVTYVKTHKKSKQQKKVIQEKIDAELHSLQYQLTKPIIYDNLSFKSQIAMILPEQTTLLEFKSKKGVITMKDMDFLQNVMYEFYDTDIKGKIKGSYQMGHESNSNQFYKVQKEKMDQLLGPGAYFYEEAETNEKIGGKIPNGKFQSEKRIKETKESDWRDQDADALYEFYNSEKGYTFDKTHEKPTQPDDQRDQLNQVEWSGDDALGNLLFKKSASATMGKTKRTEEMMEDTRGPLQVSQKQIDKHQPEFSFMFKRTVKKGPKHLPNSLIYTEEWKFQDHDIRFTKIVGPGFTFVNKDFNNQQNQAQQKIDQLKLKELQNQVPDPGQYMLDQTQVDKHVSGVNMELATMRKDLNKKPEGEGDTLILLHAEPMQERFVRNIIFSKMLARNNIFKKPKYHRDLTAIQDINYGLVDKSITIPNFNKQLDREYSNPQRGNYLNAKNLSEENYSHEVNLEVYLRKMLALKSFTQQQKVDPLKRLVKPSGKDPKQAPNTLDQAMPPNMNIIANPVQNSASVMKSGSEVGGRNAPVAKEPKKPSNSEMVYKSAIEIKPGISSGMAKPTEKSEQFVKKQIQENVEKQKKEGKLEEKMKKMVQITLQREQKEREARGIPEVVEKVDPQKKSKLLNQKKIEELQKKLFDVQIRLKNTGKKVN